MICACHTGFSATPATTATATLFGQSQQTQPTLGGGLFGNQANKPLFGTVTTTTSSSLFGGGTSLFGANTQNKVFIVIKFN